MRVRPINSFNCCDLLDGSLGTLAENLKLLSRPMTVLVFDAGSKDGSRKLVQKCAQTSTVPQRFSDPDEAPAHPRRLVRSNFCPGSKGCWTETNANRSGAVKHFRHHNEFAYPVNTLGKPEAVEAIGRWATGRGIQPLGRWGTWEHMNSDVATQLGIEAAKKILEQR
jgi:hypothetical protein